MLARELYAFSVQENVVEGVAHHHFSFQLRTAISQSCGGFRTDISSIETNLTATESSVSTIWHT